MMTIQKAMKVRSELKKVYADLERRLENTSDTITLTNESEELSDEAINLVKTEKCKKIPQLDGLTYSEAITKSIAIIEELEKLNVAIEVANRGGHNLLFKECCLKNKLAVYDKMINTQRNLILCSITEDIDYTQKDINGAWKRTTKFVHNFVAFDEEQFNVKVLKRQTEKELEAVRDELTAFNATAKVAYELPEDLL